MRGTAMALVVVAVAAAGDAAAQMLDRTSRPPASAVQAAGWTDHPIRPGVTSIKTAHFEELRARIAALRAREGLPPVRWTDGSSWATATAGSGERRPSCSRSTR